MTTTLPAPSGVRLDALLQLPDLAFGVTPYRRETVRLPVRTVLERGVGTVARGDAPLRVSIDLGPSGPRTRGRHVRRRALPRPEPAAKPPLTFQMPDGPVEASLVVGESATALQRALREQLAGTTDAEVRRLADLARAEPAGPGPEALLEAMQGRRHHLGEQGSQVLWCRREFEQAHPVLAHAPSGALRAPSLREAPVGVVTVTRPIDVGGHAVPRRAFVLAVGPRGRPVVHDGRRLVRGVLDMDRVPDDLLDAFDAGGAVEPASLQALLPLGHLTARCLVRVPGRAELAGLDAQLPRPRRRLLTRPAYALDSCAPVELTGREPVIVEPALGAWVAARVSLGTFLPDDGAARRLDSTRHPDAPSWLVLADASLGL